MKWRKGIKKGTQQLQCKDFDTIPILEFLERHFDENPQHPAWCQKYTDVEPPQADPRYVGNAFPDEVDGIPVVGKLITAKMSNLISRRLVAGSRGHDTRGDYQLTKKGKAYLMTHRQRLAKMQTSAQVQVVLNAHWDAEYEEKFAEARKTFSENQVREQIVYPRKD